IEFLESFESTQEAGSWHKSNIIQYIKKMNGKSELLDWSIAFQTSTNPGTGSISKKVADWNMFSSVRSGIKSEGGIFTIPRGN
mgnify:CR=1